MPAKKAAKRVATRTERVQARAKEFAHKRPAITLAVLATLVGMLVSIGPTLTWAIHYYETREHAGFEVEALKQVLIQQQKDAASALAGQAHDSARALAWASVQGIKTEVTVSRNRINDCDIAEQKHALTSPLERAACTQYRDEYADASKRFDAARRTALELSK